MIFIVFKRLGMASIFKHIEGSAQECNTSVDVIIIRIFVIIGKTKLLSTSKTRLSLILKESSSFIYESKSKLTKSLPSYDQNHWCLTALTVKSPFSSLSRKYIIKKEGTPRANNTNAGNKVQIISNILKLYSLKRRICL